MRKIAVTCAALLLLAACSSSSKKGSSTEVQPIAKPTAKQAEYERGRTALQKMYISARGWAGDVQPFRLQSQFTLDAPTSEGQAGLWRGSFGSPSKRMMKLFVWSGWLGGCSRAGHQFFS